MAHLKDLLVNGDAKILGEIHSPKIEGSISMGRAEDTDIGVSSTALGIGVEASKKASHAEGYETIASGDFGSHAEGYKCHADGAYGCHAEGHSTYADRWGSHAEGYSTRAMGYYSHAEGSGTVAQAESSHSEGISTYAGNKASHAEGYNTAALGLYSHAEGKSTSALGKLVLNTSINGVSNSDGSWRYTYISKPSSLLVGDFISTYHYFNLLSGARVTKLDSTNSYIYTDAELELVNESFYVFRYGVAYGESSHVEGENCLALGAQSHAGGRSAEAVGLMSFAHGDSVVANGHTSFASGCYSIAYGNNSVSFSGGPLDTVVISGDANSKIYTINSSSIYSLIPGMVLGYNNTYAQIISITGSTVTLQKTLSPYNGLVNEMVIIYTGAIGPSSCALGLSTIAKGENQLAIGSFNIPNTESAFIIGNAWMDMDGGVGNEERSNACSIGWNGDAWFQGDVYVGSTSGTNRDAGSKKLITASEVTSSLANSGVTAGSYGPSANASPAHSGTFSVPYVTVDAKGRVTAASSKTITLPSDRLFETLTPTGTAITSSASSPNNINKTDYVKVGRYYCSSNTNAENISNLPERKAFMMTVSSPLSTTIDNETGTWVYRIRKITYYTGTEYIQDCSTDGTAGNWGFGPWRQILTSNSNINGNLLLDAPGNTAQSGEPYIQWQTVGTNTPRIGFASDQSDGTFLIASLKGSNYQSGLAIGGGSGNLLWKGNRVLDQGDVINSVTANSSKIVTSGAVYAAIYGAIAASY